MSRKVNSATVDMVRSFEGLYIHPYLDAVGVPTIGYGTTYYEGGVRVTMSDPHITQDRAIELLGNDLNEHSGYVEKMVTVAMTDNQFGALVSFCYNLGPGSLQKSTLLKLLNTGDYSGAAGQFVLWNKAGGTVLAGLTRRRLAERDLFLTAAIPDGVQNSEGNVLPDGPSDSDINVKLEEIEKEVSKS